MNIQKYYYKTVQFVKRNQATILSCFAVVGTVSSVVMAIKATPKALELIEDASADKGEKLTKTEVVIVAGKCYIPTALSCSATVACILGANILNKRQQASLISAYTLLDQNYKDYKNKVRDIYGEDAEKEIRTEIARDVIKDSDIMTPPTEDNTMLFYDEYSGRVFESTEADVMAAEYHFNRNFILRGYATLNEFYDFLGLLNSESGDYVGWSIEAGIEYGYQWIDFWHDDIYIENDNGDEELVKRIAMPFGPTADFIECDFD